VRDPQGMGNRD